MNIAGLIGKVKNYERIRKNTIGYREAMIQGRAQDKAILNMIADKEIN